MKLDSRSKIAGLIGAMAFLVPVTVHADTLPPKPVTATAATNTTANASHSVKSAVPKGKVIVTGSNIPQDVKRIGRTTDSISPVLIIDQQDIQHSGAATVGEVLRRVPFATTGPGR